MNSPHLAVILLSPPKTGYSLILENKIAGIPCEKKQAVGQEKISETNLADQLANRDFTYFLLVMACIEKLDIFILLAAVGSNIFAIYLTTRRGQRDAGPREQ